MTAVPKKPSTSKKVIFMVITFVLGVFVLELGVRMMEIVRDRFFTQENGFGHSPFVDYKNVRKVFEVKNSNGVDYYTRTQYHPFIARSVRFPVEKDAGTLRIFCLGGSAAMGWPHDLSLSYPAFLQKKLELLFPLKKIDVINVAASTYASYRVRVVFDEVINYEPDLVLIYSGNNEFLEKILYRENRQLGNPWKHIAIVRTVYHVFSGVNKKKQVIDIEHYEPTFLIDVALGNTSKLKISPVQSQQVLEHYRYNLRAMVEQAQKKHIPVMLMTVPVNLRDWRPHASIHNDELDTMQLYRWQRLYREGLRAFQNGAYSGAVKNFSQALAIDDQYAELHFYHGKTYLEQDSIQQAREHFTQSLKTDAYPFRALPEFNAVLREITGESRVPLVDIWQALAKRSAYGMIGPDVLVDHVHPTVASNQVIADEVLLAMKKNGLLKKTDTISPAKTALAIPEHAEATLPLIKNLFLVYRVLLQFDKMDDLYQRCLSLPPYEKNTEAYRRFLVEFDQYLQVVQPYEALLFAQKTGQLQDKFTRDEALDIVNNYIEINRKSLASNMTTREFEQYLPEIDN